MSKEDIFEYFYTNSANLSVRSVLLALFAGLCVAAVIFITYYISYKGVAYNVKFNISLVVILLISIVIMLMISSNIVISLGMVGALSIVRFRTAIKDSRDTVFIFWAIAEGLSIGSQNFKLSVITTLFIALVLIASTYLPKMQTKYLVIINAQPDLKTEDAESIIKDNSKFFKLRSSSSNESRKEMIYEVILSRKQNAASLSALSSLEGIKSVSLVAETMENAS